MFLAYVAAVARVGPPESGGPSLPAPTAAGPNAAGPPSGRGAGTWGFSESPSSGLGSRPRVLVVEDSESTREMYAWSMRAAGWLVEEADNGHAALLAAVVFHPDVIVMDLRLP